MHVVVASHHRLPVAGYGGSQRVVVALVRGLVAAGHRVTLLAQPGSKVPEAHRLIDVPARAFKDPAAGIASFVPPDADVVHAHFPLRSAPPGPPVLQTLHGNGKPGATLGPNTVFLSRDHARRHGGTTFVYNGLDPADLTYRRRKERWDLFIGQLHSNRGYHWAIEAAKRCGRRLLLAGGWRPSFSDDVKFVGEVGDKRKRVLLARARAVWNPVQWDDPFGLVNIEALWSGTPVIGTRRGALPEILTPDVGVLGDTLEELIERSSAADGIDPAACRARAERLFSHHAMAAAYVAVYQHLIATGTLPATTGS